MIAFCFSSCKKNGCTDSSATNFDANSGSDDGSCIYDYAVFTGTYQMRDTTFDLTGITAIKNYELIISYNGLVNEVELQNLGNAVVNFKADITANKFTVPAQGNLTDGAGVLNGNKLRVAYSYNGLSCVGTGNKK